jgi:anti-sigma-K factor RskA
MSDEHDSPSPAEHYCGDAAVYLLGLLDERRSEEFLEHARSCALCGDDLAALAPAVDHLATAVPQVPAPARAKRDVMAVVRDEADAHAAGTAAAAGAAAGAAAPARSTARSRPPRRRRFALRPALALAGAGTLVAGVLIGALATPFGGGSARVSDSASRVVSADVTLAGASAALHQSSGHTWLTVAHFPEPSSGHVYEVWVKGPGHDALPRATDSLFAPTTAGTATVAVPDSSGASVVMVTQEPAGGTRQPTTTPVIVAHVS